jgi:hypothetical protein
MLPGLLGATNVIVNGGFEAASFSGWITSVNSTSALLIS